MKKLPLAVWESGVVALIMSEEEAEILKCILGNATIVGAQYPLFEALANLLGDLHYGWKILGASSEEEVVYKVVKCTDPS